MQRLPVRSSTIVSIGYATQERMPELEFRQSGEAYQYFDVPPEDYAAFLAAESKGTYQFNSSKLAVTATRESGPH